MSDKFRNQWLIALKSMNKKEYWNKPNTVEFFAFLTKVIIIFPGLLFGIHQMACLPLALPQ